MDERAPLLAELGSRIRAARLACGLSQAELASKIGMTRSSVANLESGRQDMTISKLSAACLITGANLAEILNVADLPVPTVHEVRIGVVYQVECRTCGEVLAHTDSRTDAKAAKCTHLADPEGTNA